MVEAPEEELAEEQPQTDVPASSTALVVTLSVLLLLAIVGAASLGLYARRLEAERKDLETRLVRQERNQLDLREELTKAEVALQEKDAQLATREVALAEATQPDLPVRVSFRPAWMGQGMVASFRNVSNQQLTLMIEFRDPSTRSSRDFAFVVEAGATADVGHAQGWLVTSGQSVRVAASGYKSVTAFAP